MTEWTHFSESRGLVGIRDWNDNLPKAQTLIACVQTPPLLLSVGKIGEGAPSRRGWGVVCTRANTKMTICPRHGHLLGRFLRAPRSWVDCKPLRWKMSPQGIGRRRKSSLRSCQYSCHTLDHTGKITTVAGNKSSFAPSCKYHSFFFFTQKISERTEIFLFLHLTFYLAMFSDVRFQFSWACKDSLFISIFWQPCILL